MQLVEFDALSEEQEDAIVDGEPEPYGGVGEDLNWREKTRHVGLREGDGRLIAVAGMVLADVKVGEQQPFQVVGIGGVLVTLSKRGRGLSLLVCERVLELAAASGVERAMLFCLPGTMGLYARFGFLPIEAPVWAEQPAGLTEIPLRAMWKALSGAPTWPAGKVEVLGEPF